jgi:hypothetical protein
MAAPKVTGFFDTSNRVELVATIIMSLAAIFTAWAAFQSAKWSGEQAIAFAEAGAARTESTRFDTRAGQVTSIDVATFTNWINALNEDLASGAVDLTGQTTYEPTPGTLSGFISERFRQEFRPAFEAWTEAFLADRANAPPTPFSMEEYVLADQLRAEELVVEAEEHVARARQNNQNSDNYVLTVVAFALVLFFSGVSSKLESPKNSLIAIVVGSVVFVGGTVVILILPKIMPF